MIRLIPKGQKGINTEKPKSEIEIEYQKLKDYLNNYFGRNINKIKKETPKNLSEEDDSKRPQEPNSGHGTNLRGVTRSAKNGQKLK